jgi:hypothetical protein
MKNWLLHTNKKHSGIKNNSCPGHCWWKEVSYDNAKFINTYFSRKSDERQKLF